MSRKRHQTQTQETRSLKRAYALLALCCVVLYGITLFNYYGLDDYLVTFPHEQVRKGIGGLYEIFTTNYVDDEKYKLDYRPLAKASFAIEYELFGWNPHISHFVNVIIYTAACLALLHVLLRIFGRENLFWVYAGVLLYAAHPVHTEVVASLKNREELFVMIFGIAALYCMLQYQEQGHYKYLICGMFFYLLALLSKISALPFVASVPLLLYYYNQERGKYRPWHKPALVLGTMLALTAAYYAVVISSLPGFTRPYDYVETPIPYLQSISEKLGVAGLSLWWYVRLLFVPYPLSFYYGIDYVPVVPLTHPLALIGWGIHVAVFTGILWFRKRRRIVSLLLAWYLVQIAMYANVVLPLAGIVAERVLLIASAPAMLLAAYGIVHGLGQAKLLQNNKGFLRQISLPVIVIGMVFLLYAGITIRRNFDWKDTLSLFRADIGHLHNSARANFMIAKEIRRLYRTDENLTKEKLEQASREAIKYYRRAIEIYPNFAQALEALGTIYLTEKNNISAAVGLFMRAYNADTTMWRSAYNVGRYYQLQKNNDSALVWFMRAIQARPQYLKALVEAAKLYYVSGHKKTALSLNDTILKYYPSSFVPYYNLGMYYLLEKDTARAVQYFEEDIARGEPEKFPYTFLMRYYLKQRDTMNAVRVRNTAATNERLRNEQKHTVEDD
ncbi:MAG: hypothetical protein NZM35_05740 [Chitinophagales bacterium]|nr:hypothetical protein [Chitinophagales bacterium]